MLSLKSQLQCRDRNNPFSGQIIKPRSVPKLSGCLNNIEKLGIFFPNVQSSVHQGSGCSSALCVWLLVPVPGVYLLFGEQRLSALPRPCAGSEDHGDECWALGCSVPANGSWVHPVLPLHHSPWDIPVMSPWLCWGLCMDHSPRGFQEEADVYFSCSTSSIWSKQTGCSKESPRSRLPKAWCIYLGGGAGLSPPYQESQARPAARLGMSRMKTRAGSCTPHPRGWGWLCVG